MLRGLHGRYGLRMTWLKEFVGLLRAAPPPVVDAALVVALSAAAVAEALNPWADRHRSPDALVVALVVLTIAPLLWRRRQPEPVLAVALSAWTVTGLLGYAVVNFQFLGTLIALYGVALERDRRRSLLALAAFGICVAISFGAETRYLEEPLRVQDWALGFAIPAMAWSLGAAHRRLRENARQLQVLTRRLQQEQAARQRRAVVEERNRIARELHDVVAHHISTIAMQANAARTMLPGRPEQADASLAFIHASSRDALIEMRLLIGILKSADPDADELRAPRPTLADLEQLVARANQASLATELEIRGRPRPLPVVLELSAYRIVQEALTNAIKHAGPVRARVLVHYRADRLCILVTNTGVTNTGGRPGSPSEPSTLGNGHGRGHDGTPGLVGVRVQADMASSHQELAGGSGFGLFGMRERVALFGGSLHTGPEPDGGFRVAATLPIPRAGGSP
jgi:signal transduction histidine kinase